MARKMASNRPSIWEELKNASDRAAVILAATYVDETLFEAIVDALELDASTVDELTGNNGPLGTFSNRVMFAHSVGMIGDQTKRDLTIVRKLRNVAAHDLESFVLEPIWKEVELRESVVISSWR